MKSRLRLLALLLAGLGTCGICAAGGTPARMIILGDAIPAARAKELGLIDEIVTGDLLEGAMAYARLLVDSGKGPRRVRDMPPKVASCPISRNSGTMDNEWVENWP